MIHELRIYTVHPGKMGALLARFRDHTTELFEKAWDQQCWLLAELDRWSQ